MLRLRLPAEVKVSESRCQRAKVNGALLILMPKLDPNENAISLRADQRARTAAGSTATNNTTSSSSGSMNRTALKNSSNKTQVGNSKTLIKPKKLSLQEQIMLEAQEAAAGGSGDRDTGNNLGNSDALKDGNIGTKTTGTVDVSNIVRRRVEDRVEVTPIAAETVFDMSNRVVELD